MNGTNSAFCPTASAYFFISLKNFVEELSEYDLVVYSDTSFSPIFVAEIVTEKEGLSQNVSCPEGLAGISCFFSVSPATTTSENKVDFTVWFSAVSCNFSEFFDTSLAFTDWGLILCSCFLCSAR